MSLDALIFPRERGLQHGWIRAMRVLPTSLRRELTAFSFVLDYAVPDCILPTPGRRTAATWEDELGRVADLRPADAGYELARPAFHYALEPSAGPEAFERDDVRALVERRAGVYGPAAVATARLAWEDPAPLLGRFVDLLQGYWERAFADEWRRLGPRLVAERPCSTEELAHLVGLSAAGTSRASASSRRPASSAAVATATTSSTSSLRTPRGRRDGARRVHTRGLGGSTYETMAEATGGRA